MQQKFGRRGFIAALFAPLVARWMPKPRLDPDAELALSLEEFRLKYIVPAIEKNMREGAHRMDEMFAGLRPFPESWQV